MVTGDGRFDAIVRRHSGAVTAYARAVSGDTWTADDAVQETFLRAWKYFDTFDGRGSVEGWLIRICRNCLIDMAARPTAELHAAPPTTAEAGAPADTSHEIYDLLERLPLAHREVLALCGLLGYDYESAAALLDVPVGTVRSRVHRARESLRRALLDGRDGIEEVSA